MATMRAVGTTGPNPAASVPLFRPVMGPDPKRTAPCLDLTECPIVEQSSDAFAQTFVWSRPGSVVRMSATKAKAGSSVAMTLLEWWTANRDSMHVNMVRELSADADAPAHETERGVTALLNHVETTLWEAFPKDLHEYTNLQIQVTTLPDSGDATQTPADAIVFDLTAFE